MPVISITLIEGYSTAVKQRLCERMTDVVTETVGAVPEGATVIINEVGATNYMRGRTGKTPGTAPGDATDLVLGFLSALESRDLDAARQRVTEDFSMTFPGAVDFDSFEALVEWARDRYQWVKKTVDRCDQAFTPQGTVVTVSGTLHGVWLDGDAFEGIRFIDRFLVAGGRIARQEVWNDLAIAQAARAVS